MIYKGSGIEKVMLVGASTVKVAALVTIWVLLSPLTVAVTDATPGLPRVTNPVAETLATAGFEELKVTVGAPKRETFNVPAIEKLAVVTSWTGGAPMIRVIVSGVMVAEVTSPKLGGAEVIENPLKIADEVPATILAHVNERLVVVPSDVNCHWAERTEPVSVPWFVPAVVVFSARVVPA